MTGFKIQLEQLEQLPIESCRKEFWKGIEQCYLARLTYVDEFMNSITIPLITEIVAVLLLFLIEVAFNVKEHELKYGTVI